MSKKALSIDVNGIMSTVKSQVDDKDVTEVTVKIDKNKGIMNVHGKKNNEVFRVTKQIYDESGYIQSVSCFDTNAERSKRNQTIKQMYENDHFKQQEIADMLGISQSQVSNILNEKKQGKNKS